MRLILLVVPLETMPFTVIDDPSMSNPVTVEDALIKTAAIWVLFGTLVLSKLSFISLMTEPRLNDTTVRLIKEENVARNKG